MEDAGPLSHPVRPTSYKEINNFYTSTVYEKGAEVIRMLYILLGPEVFRQATDLYFARYDGQAVTIEAFVQAMQDASELDLSLFKLWYTQAGTPTLLVEEEYNAEKKQYNLIIEQSCPATPGQKQKLPMHIPIAIGLLDPDGKEISLQLKEENTICEGGKILSLTKEKQEFSFVNVKTKPVLSILRDFSAPVNITTSHTMQELAFLVKHDTDPFNRWDSFRKLKKNIILQLIDDVGNNNKLSVEPLLFELYKSILSDLTMNFSLKAELLTLPSSTEILKYMKIADPDIVYKVSSFLKTELSASLQEEFYSIYIKCISTGKYIYNAIEAGRRQLKNICLSYLLWLNNKEMLALGQKQFTQANNMTDLIGVLSTITHIDSEQREQLLINFYNRWCHEPLIMDKWLSLQAVSELPTTIKQVKNLLNHKIFDINIPNKVYALIGGFCIHNPIRFNDSSGEGYKLLAEVLLQLDQLNPQVAARMANAFSDGHSYNKLRQDLINQQLTKIVDDNKLSRNLSEIINKCMQNKG